MLQNNGGYINCGQYHENLPKGPESRKLEIQLSFIRRQESYSTLPPPHLYIMLYNYSQVCNNPGIYL